MSLTTANGGAMVPYILDPSVMLTNNGVTNPMRQLARTETIIGANEWRGVTSAGVSAEWLAEGTEAADASPTFTQPAIPTFQAAAYLFGSYEVLADSGFASQVQPLIMDAKDRLEGTAFTTGNGTTAPQGWVTGKVAAGSLVASATTDTFAVADVYSTQAGLAPRFRTSRAAWQANVAIQNRIRQFDTSGGSSLWAQLGAGTPPGAARFAQLRDFGHGRFDHRPGRELRLGLRRLERGLRHRGPRWRGGVLRQPRLGREPAADRPGWLLRILEGWWRGRQCCGNLPPELHLSNGRARPCRTVGSPQRC